MQRCFFVLKLEFQVGKMSSVESFHYRCNCPVALCANLFAGTYLATIHTSKHSFVDKSVLHQQDSTFETVPTVWNVKTCKCGCALYRLIFTVEIVTIEINVYRLYLGHIFRFYFTFYQEAVVMPDLMRMPCSDKDTLWAKLIYLLIHWYLKYQFRVSFVVY